MRRLGRFITWIGAALGVALGLSMLWPMPFTGFAWIVAVGTAKLAFAASIGLIAGGAVLERMALRAAEHAQLPTGIPE